MSRPSIEELLQRAGDVLREKGFIFEEPLRYDGKVYCNTTEKPHGHKASYTIDLGSHPRIRLKWYYRSSDDWEVVHLCEAGPMTPEERIAYKARQVAARVQREKEADDAAKKAQEQVVKWCRPADGTEAYCRAKRIPAVPGLLTMKHGDVVVVVARNARNEVRFLQRIWFDTELQRFAKSFTKRCAPRGCFFDIPGNGACADVYICEGAADGASIWTAMRGECWVIVAFDCGNLLPAAKALIDEGRLNGSDCIFVADDDRGRPPRPDGSPDNPGVRHAIAAARAVGGWFCVPARETDEPATKDANDVFAMLGQDVLMERLGEKMKAPEPQPGDAADMFCEPDLDTMPDYMDEDLQEPAPEPMPLHRTAPPQAPYPVDAFGPFAGTVKVLSDRCYVHPSVAGVVVLCSLSLLVQRLYNAKCPDYDFTPLSLFGLSVMESGGGKDLVERLALKPMKDWEREQKPEYEKLMEAYTLEEKVFQKAVRMLEKRFQNADKFDRDQYKAELAELEKTKPIFPVQPVLTSGDLNMEGLYRLLKEQTPSHGIMGAEGGILFGGLAFQTENRMRTQGMLCTAWSNGELDKGRMGEGVSKIWNRRVCMDLLLQPNVAEELFADRGMVTQGFLPRFLVTWPEIMGRDLPGTDIASLPEMQAYYQSCTELLARKPPENDIPGSELVLDALTLDGEAYGMYRDFYRWAEASIVSGGRYEPVRGFARRTAEQAMRIAGVLTAAWTPYSCRVSPEAMDAGMRIASWHLDEALRITLGESEPPKLKTADSLMRWAAARSIGRVSIRQIQQFGPNSIRTKAAAEEAVQTLLDHGWLHPAGRGEVWMGDGKTAVARHTFTVVPGYGQQS